MFESYEDIVTPEQVSEMLKMGMSQVYLLLKSGKIKAYRAGRIWKIPKRAIEEYVYQQSGLLWKKKANLFYTSTPVEKLLSPG